MNSGPDFVLSMLPLRTEFAPLATNQSAITSFAWRVLLGHHPVRAISRTSVRTVGKLPLSSNHSVVTTGPLHLGHTVRAPRFAPFDLGKLASVAAQ